MSFTNTRFGVFLVDRAKACSFPVLFNLQRWVLNRSDKWPSIATEGIVKAVTLTWVCNELAVSCLYRMNSLGLSGSVLMYFPLQKAVVTYCLSKYQYSLTEDRKTVWSVIYDSIARCLKKKKKKVKCQTLKSKLILPVFLSTSEETFQNQLVSYTTGKANSNCEIMCIFFLSLTDTEVHFKNTL